MPRLVRLGRFVLAADRVDRVTGLGTRVELSGDSARAFMRALRAPGFTVGRLGAAAPGHGRHTPPLPPGADPTRF